MAESEELKKYFESINSEAKYIFIKPSELVFEENVKMNCYYCGKYNNNWRCPPNLPDIDYKKMMEEYNKGCFVVLSFDICNEKMYQEIRNESSISLHKLLLELEKVMWKNNNSNAISFIGGSCKLCRGGCGKEKCNNPYLSRSPLEAIGVNIVKSARKYGIEIQFPTEKSFKRIGLLLWQEECGL